MRQTECFLVIEDRSIARVVALFPEEPERLPGLTKPVSARTGQYSQEMLMERQKTYVGIDVAKAGMDVAVCPSDESWMISNDEAGIRQLVSHLKTLEPALVLLEASGGLELPLVTALAVEELPVVVVNPRQVRDFARATGKLAKTDTLDAAVLAHFGEAVRPPVRPLRDSETRLLSSLVARRHQLVTILVSEKNRLSTATTVAVRPGIETHIDWLERELIDLDENLQQIIRRSPVWRRRMTSCALFLDSESRCPSLCWLTCPSWARWAAGKSPRWSEWLPSTATAAR